MLLGGTLLYLFLLKTKGPGCWWNLTTYHFWNIIINFSGRYLREVKPLCAIFDVWWLFFNLSYGENELVEILGQFFHSKHMCIIFFLAFFWGFIIIMPLPSAMKDFTFFLSLPLLLPLSPVFYTLLLVLLFLLSVIWDKAIPPFPVSNNLSILSGFCFQLRRKL